MHVALISESPKVLGIINLSELNMGRVIMIDLVQLIASSSPTTST
jgi:hypothetical protein